MKSDYPSQLCGGGCFGPLTVVSGILVAENMLLMIVKQPELVLDFVEYVTGYIIRLAERETAGGADFFWIAEPLASLLSPANFWTFSGQYLERIYQKAGVPGFLHVCGKTLKHTAYMARTGAEVLSIDYCTDIGECIRMVDSGVIVMGNVSPMTLRWGSREEVAIEVKRILEMCKGFSNFILSTGCSIIEDTPYENMMVLFELCESVRS